MTKPVQRLRNYLFDNPTVRRAFQAAFDEAYKFEIPQFKEYNIHSLDDYLTYMERLLRWIPSETVDGKAVYNRLCMFYFIIDRPPVLILQTPIDSSSVSPWTWLSQWLIDYSREIGRFMDTSESLTMASLASFYKSPAYHMQDYAPYPGDPEWKTFNDFFARKLAQPRPIDGPDDFKVIVSAADSVFSGWWKIDNNAEVSFQSKGIPWSIGQLLKDSAYGPRFHGGRFMHAFLNTTDYHRQHAPVSGIVKEAKVIPGLCYLEVDVKDDPTNDDGNKKSLFMRRRLAPTLNNEMSDDRGQPSAPDTPGYQFIQARGLIVLDSPYLGLVAVLPIGMAQVSSVALTVNEGDVVKKGEEIAYFQFGGSDIVLVFEPSSNVEFTAKEGEHYNFGKQIALAQDMLLPQSN